MSQTSGWLILIACVTLLAGAAFVVTSPDNNPFPLGSAASTSQLDLVESRPVTSRTTPSARPTPGPTARPTPGPTSPQCVSSNATCWPSRDRFAALRDKLVGDVVLQHLGLEDTNNPLEIAENDIKNFKNDALWKQVTHLKNKRLNQQEGYVPGAVVMAHTTADVVAAIRFASGYNLATSVKSTGHCYSGNCMSGGSLHIDLTQMKSVTVDKSAMRMFAQPGANFKAMYEAADKNGVLLSGGMCPTVGPVGYALGGGHGPLIRSLGLAADNIVSIDLITASGKEVTASGTSNPELFWALRGGGGGAFGIVTEMRFKVHAAPKQMVSLSCAWPVSKKPIFGTAKIISEPILSKWQKEIMPALPDPWMFYTVSMKRPLGPKVKKFNGLTMNGLLIVEGLYNGEWSDEMLQSIDPLLKLGKEEQLKCDFTNFSSFKDWHDQAWFADEGPIPFRTYMASSFAQPDFDSAKHAKLLTETVMSLPLDAVNMMFGVQLGGKVSRPAGGINSTSVSADFRNALFMQENDSDWNFETADVNQIKWARSVGDAVADLSGFSGSYLNEPDPSKARGGQYEKLFWGEANFKKLQAVKRVWDSDAMFDCKQCVYN